jgi:fatty-acyl-CoA synthase
LRLIEDRAVTTMMGVPATYMFLAQDPSFHDADLTSLRLAVVGGAPMPEPLLELWRERGVDIVQGYGLTEAAPNVLCLPPEDATRKIGFAGKPYPHVEVALRDPESGDLLAGAATGELVVRGPNVFSGYWRDPEATAGAFADGWLLTGDVAECDADGYYRIVDRIKDMFISGGENVYPAEIEAVLHAHPAVAEAAVVGIPDERWGETPVVVAVPARDNGLAAHDVLRHCRRELTSFKRPSAAALVEELPATGIGKSAKAVIRQRILDGEIALVRAD